jgi:hypothetical protein
MRNFNFYKNEIEEIVKELPSNIKEWGVSEMLLHSAEGSYLRLNLNDGRDMFVLFYELLEEIYKNDEEFNNDEYYDKFFEEVIKNSSLWELSEDIRELAIKERYKL